MRLRKVRGRCLMRQGTWLNWMLPLPQTLLSWPAFRNGISKEQGEGWSKKYVTLSEEDQVSEHKSKLDMIKSMEPDRMHPQVLRELADIVVKPLLVIFDHSEGMGEMPKGWRKANVTPVFRKGRRTTQGAAGQAVSLWSLGRWKSS